MDRLETVRAFVFQAYASIQDDALRHLAIAHAAECAAIAALLADRYGENEELAYICGLCHDYYRFAYNGVKEHAQKGALLIRKKLAESGHFKEAEITMIETGIRHHSEKTKRHDRFSQIIKCADALSQSMQEGSTEDLTKLIAFSLP